MSDMVATGERMNGPSVTETAATGKSPTATTLRIHSVYLVAAIVLLMIGCASLGVAGFSERISSDQAEILQLIGIAALTGGAICVGWILTAVVQAQNLTMERQQSAIDAAARAHAEFATVRKTLITHAELQGALERLRLQLEREAQAQKRNQEAIIRFRMQYFKLSDALKRYAREVTGLGDNELLRRFDQMLDVRKILGQEVSQLRGSVILGDQIERVLLDVEESCKKILLETRFSGPLNDDSMNRYKDRIGKAASEFDALDREVIAWMKTKIQPV
jgi:hypothetical protein